jgi:uncharacterized membrane protein YhhN
MHSSTNKFKKEEVFNTFLVKHLIYLGAYFPTREGWFTCKPTGHSSLQGQALLNNLYNKLSQYKFYLTDTSRVQ